MIRRSILNGLLTAGLIGLTACAVKQISAFEAECQSRTSSFPSFAHCLRSNIQADRRIMGGPYADLVRLYLAYADALADRVEKGEMREVDARLQLAEVNTRMKSIAQRRDSASQASSSASAALMLQGLAIMNQTPTTYAPSSPTTTYSFPGRRPITCTQTGSFVSCL